MRSSRAGSPGSSAQRGFQADAQLGLVRKRVSGVAPLHHIFHTHLNRTQCLRVAVDIELALCHGVKHFLRHFGGCHLA